MYTKYKRKNRNGDSFYEKEMITNLKNINMELKKKLFERSYDAYLGLKMWPVDKKYKITVNKSHTLIQQMSDTNN